MSYRQPKQMKDGALELNQTLLDQSLKRSSQREATQQARTSQNLSALTNIASTFATQAIAPKADGLAELNKDYANATQKLYKKVGSADYETGYEGTDKKADVFMNGIIDDYYGIKNNMKNMKDPSLGMQDLANIENMIDEYGKGVANMLAFNSAIKEASTADLNSGGKLSNAGAPSSQLQIIRKITGGGSEAEDIEFKREGNNIILYDTKSDTSLNITEFNRSQDRGEDYLKYAIPTEETTIGFYGDIVKNKNDEGVYNPTFITKGANDTYSMTPQQQVDYKNSIMGDDPSKPKEKATGGSFRGLLQGDGNIAESIWEDQMYEAGLVKNQWPTGDDPDAWNGLSSDEIIANATRENATKEDKELYQAFYDEYYKPALDFLANQSLEAGAASMQIALDDPTEDVNKQIAESAKNLEVEEEKLPEDLQVEGETEEGNINIESKKEKEKDDFVYNTASKIFDYESKSGSGTGGGLQDFGFTDPKYANKKYDKYRDDNGDLTREGAQIIFEEEYMSKVPSEYPKQIRQQLADYEFNSSMSTLDLMLLANGDLTLREARDEAEHGDLWKEKKEEIEKLMQEDPVAFNEKIKQAKRDIYKDLDPKKYDNTWKNRIDMFDEEEEESAEDLVNNLTK
tara:strand:+ start:4051 stop:5937 length:1887 start_codon:yes stop_codon:yes gene_type:complete